MPLRGAPAWARGAAVALVAALLAFQVIRAAAVADRESRPALAWALWPSHPRVMLDRALLDIAASAVRGQGATPAIEAAVRRAAVKAPLSADPFLIAGAIAETRERGEVAERLLLAARARDPRSRGTRFLLAQRYVRSGRVAAGLMEMQALVNLQARGPEAFGPALAEYARTPGAVPELRTFFARNPSTEARIMNHLALDPANADLVLSLASGPTDPDWRPRLIAALAQDGQFARARLLWSRFYGVRADAGLFNPGFAEVSAPPPFNWDFPQTTEGVAEPDGKGGLSVLFYGRANAVLASQLLLLSPGPYRLTASSAGSDVAGVRWVVRCADAERDLLTLNLRPATVSGAFAVPSDCRAQWLELRGVAGDSPRTIELRIRALRLDRGVAG
jgi:hypothetical protein